MKLCSLCHWLLQKRRWLFASAAAVPVLLLCFLLPRWLGMAPLSALLVLLALLLEYSRLTRKLAPYRYSRVPIPQDAQAEIVAVDASLIDRGTQLQAAAQPIIPHDEMSMRMGSGALLLGTAMIFTADELPPTDAHALLSGAARLNLRAQTLRSRSPVIDRGVEEGMRRVTVQDGPQERSYFMADAKTVAAGCGAIWEEHVRLMGQNDREQILDAARYMEAGGCRVFAFAMAADNERPIFLGLAALGEGLNADVVHDLHELRGMGYTLILRDDNSLPLDIAALRKTLDIPDLHARPDICLCAGEGYSDSRCLSIFMTVDDQLFAPLAHLREHFQFTAHALRSLFSLTAICLLCCCLAASRLSLLLVSAVLAAACLSFARPAFSRHIRWPGAATAGAAALLARLLLSAAVPDFADLGGTALCIILAALCSTTLLPRGSKPTFRALLPLLITVFAALAMLLLMNVSALPACLLSVLFGAVCGGVAGYVCLLTSR